GGVAVSDAAALRDTADVLARTELAGDDFQLVLARTIRAVSLIYHGGRERDAGFQLLTEVRQAFSRDQFEQLPNPGLIPLLDTLTEEDRARRGDVDGAIELSRGVIGELFATGMLAWTGPATAVLVEALLSRGAESDLREARAAIDSLVAVPTDPGF